MFKWIYFNPVEIHFHPGIIENLSNFTSAKKILLVTSPGASERGTSKLLINTLKKSLKFIYDGVHPNPTIESIKEAYTNIKSYEYDLTVALGGGSVIDTAKALVSLKASGSEEWMINHFKTGISFPENFCPKPIFAIPTTAGTGSDVTMWATIWDMTKKKKYSLSHPSLYPKKSFLDPGLTLSLSRENTIFSGLDALSHAMEAIWNKNNNPISDCMALKAISLIYNNLPKLKDNPSDLKLRSLLLQASLLAGLAFSNTKTALAHSISYPLTLFHGMPHGLACSFLLPNLIALNGKGNFDRIKEMSKSLNADSSINSMIESLKIFLNKLNVPFLFREYGIQKNDIRRLVDEALSYDRKVNNLVQVDNKRIEKLLQLSI